MAVGGSSKSKNSSSSKMSSTKSTNGVTKSGSIGMGAIGSAVSKIQSQLKGAGYKVGVDGKFGAKTKAAVQGAQANSPSLRRGSYKVTGKMGMTEKQKTETMHLPHVSLRLDKSFRFPRLDFS
jgi:Putative peptidoglycan binding domain